MLWLDPDCDQTGCEFPNRNGSKGNDQAGDSYRKAAREKLNGLQADGTQRY